MYWSGIWIGSATFGVAVSAGGGTGRIAVWNGTTWELADNVANAAFEAAFGFDSCEVWVGGAVDNAATLLVND